MAAAGNRNRDVSLPAQAADWDAGVAVVVGFRPCEANFFGKHEVCIQMARLNFSTV